MLYAHVGERDLESRNRVGDSAGGWLSGGYKDMDPDTRHRESDIAHVLQTGMEKALTYAQPQTQAQPVLFYFLLFYYRHRDRDRDEDEDKDGNCNPPTSRFQLLMTLKTLMLTLQLLMFLGRLDHQVYHLILMIALALMETRRSRIPSDQLTIFNGISPFVDTRPSYKVSTRTLKSRNASSIGGRNP